MTATTLGSATDTWGYSVFGEPQTYSAAYGGSTIFSNQFTRDKLGRITQKTETIGGITDTYAYRYDTAGRLDEVKKNNVVVSTYTYDSNSNRLTYTTAGGTTSGTYVAQDRLTQYRTATYTYTANGELATKTIGTQTTAYQYDALGNLTAATLPDGTQLAYIIDGSNRRVGKKVNGILTQGFLYQDGLEPIAQLDGAGAIISTFVYASKAHVPDYMVKAGVTYRIISDHLGSPRMVVDTSTGAVVQRIDYDEFGNVVSDTNPGFQPFGFAGGIYDGHTNLVRFGMRDYDPETGRWTVKDPILFGGRDTNLYGYVENNPINWVDPFGLCRSFGERWWENFRITNETVYGYVMPPLLGAVLGTGKVTARTLRSVTLGQWARSGFRSMAINGVRYTALESGLIAGVTSFYGFLLAGGAYEAGIAVGSVINVALTDDPNCSCK